MGFPRQEYWSGLPCPPPSDLPDPGIEPVSHVSCVGRRVLSGGGGVAQSCLTLCDPMGCSPPGSSVRGIFQARVLEGAAISRMETGGRGRGGKIRVVHVFVLGE